MNKKSLSEQDIRTKYITPAILSSGWDRDVQLREEVSFTKGKVIVRRKTVKRGEQKRADYILYFKPYIPIAIVEAKDNNHNIGDGMEQALEYAEILDIPFVFTSNGDGFMFYDKTAVDGNIQTEISLEEFPTPKALWDKYKIYKNITGESEKIVAQDYYYNPINNRTPRYYQSIAVNRTVEAIAKGQDRILLIMATGTGKTYTAFQIIYRLWKSRTKKRILFLADRNILVDDPMKKDFKFFNSDSNNRKMIKIKNKEVDKAYEMYFAIYQGVTGQEGFADTYREFSPDFFDLIIIDECHRGSAKDDSAWRRILKYFKNATQIGMTATPKETKETSNIEYFGEPIYTYSLKQGIEDGFLAPYKVVRVGIDKDLEGYRPTKGKLDKYGNEIEDREYNIKDYDKNLVIEQRTELVAKRVSDFLKKNKSRFAKTIFFCVDINHAQRMTQALRNENADLVKQNYKYVMQITGDNDEGKAELENFMNPNEPYPVLVTTSKLLTTGVDADTCQFIILDSNINSMTEFKQIIGRGTRINEEHNKLYFTIIDFRNVTKLFADKDFDGEPAKIKETDGDIPPEETEDNPPDEGVDDQAKGDKAGQEVPADVGFSSSDEDIPKRIKYYVNDVPVSIINERVQYLDGNGKLITESLVDYTKKNIRSEYASLDEFLQKWNNAEKKTAIIDELEQKGIFFDELKEEVSKDLDPFDLICHIAFDMPPLTRKERANNVKKRGYFGKYNEVAKQVLEALLDKYTNEGLANLESMEILKVPDMARFGTPLEIIKCFGNKEKFMEAIAELENELYVA
ncbi:type I restriction enzyme, R subunit [Anaerocolumna jejuensis DSM 15929]|uniref:Type I restriction enzyme, R subunit n=1 Tax=Anaerocolumna jejuensis DSM 15929 TaxID=1121322 RepID=A0A1M6MBH8_9FIRM|nr:DEAD/DEAH box helicase family protein [Anaerocolumna jejuensis]SHJ80799.1 type I restriction enzyme, R subunit [Anaerocolumna jejuensis DSM 15929]